MLCEEDGKEVLRFSELFGVREPYWVLGSRAGRPRRHLSRGEFFALNSFLDFLVCGSERLQFTHFCLSSVSRPVGFFFVFQWHLFEYNTRVALIALPVFCVTLLTKRSL